MAQCVLRVDLIIFAGKTKVYILLEEGGEKQPSWVLVGCMIKKQKVAFNRFVEPRFDFS